VQNELLSELRGGTTMTARDLPEVLKGRPRLPGDFVGAVGTVLVEKGLGVHAANDIRNPRRLQQPGRRVQRIPPVAQLFPNRAMDINQIRRNNLALLKHASRTFEAISDRSGVPPNYLSQINTGARNMGDEVARKLEAAYGQDRGWMDTLQVKVTVDGTTYHSRNTEPVPETLGRVPVISWVAAGNPQIVADPYAPGLAEEWIDTEVAVSRHTFALRVRGLSMLRPDGTGFPDGAIIVVEPELEARHKDYVVVRFPNTDEATFKQLIIDGPNKLLMSLNPAYPPITITEDARLCGVVTEKRIIERLR
jgi:SOS-response transcriptional repressor LexA